MTLSFEMPLRRASPSRWPDDQRPLTSSCSWRRQPSPLADIFYVAARWRAGAAKTWRRACRLGGLVHPGRHECLCDAASAEAFAVLSRRRPHRSGWASGRYARRASRPRPDRRCRRLAGVPRRHRRRSAQPEDGGVLPRLPAAIHRPSASGVWLQFLILGLISGNPEHRGRRGRRLRRLTGPVDDDPASALLRRLVRVPVS